MKSRPLKTRQRRRSKKRQRRLEAWHTWAKGPKDRRTEGPSCMIAPLGREVKDARWVNAARPLQVGPFEGGSVLYFPADRIDN
jgi:hypothetical protein